MACPNKNEDTKIMRTVVERNIKKSTTVPYNLIDLLWTGNLLDIQFQVRDLNNVLFITKLDENQYVATIKEYKNE